eukprot:344196_1
MSTGHICIICLQPLHDNTGKYARPDCCGHVFHENCIKAWENVVRKCPICKEPFHAIKPIYLSADDDPQIAKQHQYISKNIKNILQSMQRKENKKIKASSTTNSSLYNIPAPPNHPKPADIVRHAFQDLATKLQIKTEKVDESQKMYQQIQQIQVIINQSLSGDQVIMGNNENIIDVDEFNESNDPLKNLIIR